MTPVDGSALREAGEPEVQVILMALKRALDAEGGVTPATETQVQNSLYALRSASPYSEAVASLEAVAANLRLLAEAKREGRCNLYASQMHRLRKQVFA